MRQSLSSSGGNPKTQCLLLGMNPVINMGGGPLGRNLVVVRASRSTTVSFLGPGGTVSVVPVLVYQLEGHSNNLIWDDATPVEDFPRDQQDAVRYLRAHGRPVLGTQLQSMLQAIEEDPGEPGINFLSLKDMAQLMVEQGDFADPFIGPGRRGLVHAQWRIAGNGVLVWGFLGAGEILVIAQSDEVSGREAQDINVQGAKEVILKEFGYLVPRRD